MWHNPLLRQLFFLLLAYLRTLKFTDCAMYNCWSCLFFGFDSYANGYSTCFDFYYISVDNTVSLRSSRKILQVGHNLPVCSKPDIGLSPEDISFSLVPSWWFVFTPFVHQVLTYTNGLIHVLPINSSCYRDKALKIWVLGGRWVRVKGLC